MPAVTVPKQFGIGGSHLIGGAHKGPRAEPNLYQAFQATSSDIINLILVVSELIAADGNTTLGIVVPSRLLTVS